nr:thioredoxin family protein [Streptomonospora sp. PA3]
MAGAAALAAVLIVGTAIGLLRRRLDGRFRAVGRSARGARGQHPPQAQAQSVHKEAAGMDAQHSGGQTAPGTDAPPGALTSADLGAGLGERATLVQFSTAFCQPCRATRRILADVGAMVEGVAHVEIDAESHLDLVRRLDIVRTPTVLVLDAAGRITERASGQPRKADVIAALGEAIP